MTRNLTDAENEKVQQILADAAIDVARKLSTITEMKAGVAILSMFPHDDPIAMSGFRTIEDGRKALIKIALRWLKLKAH